MTEAQQIQLSEEQKEAVDAAVATIRDGGTLVIGGLAGTGKTTIIKSILEKEPGTAVAAFTGKAVSVLRSKGVPSAQTLHSLMYVPEKNDQGDLVFVKKMDMEYSAVIVDEASMINTELYNDLLSYDIPVVFVGDHGQLEPIGDNPRVMEKPDIKLEKIHRQAGESPILVFAHIVREGKALKWESVPPGSKLRRATRMQAQEQCHNFDAIICGFNKTRRAMNSAVRKNRGFMGPPGPEERIIFLKNNRNAAVFNGMLVTVKAINKTETVYDDSGPRLVFFMDYERDDGVEVKDAPVCIVGPEDDAHRMNLQVRLFRGDWDSTGYMKEVALADFGYALTAHKSQGSEFNRVLVIEEIWREKWDPKRWRYTAATRAVEELVWVGR